MQTPKQRRQMLARMGLAAPIPSLDIQRSWAWIDDRIQPEGEPDGQFRSHLEWVNKASSWIGYTGAKCFDQKGRHCRNGADFMRAHDEDSFPVVWYWPERFAEPVFVPERILRIRKHIAFAGEQGTTLQLLKLCKGLSKLTLNQIAEACGDRVLPHPDHPDRIVMTPAGIEQTRFEAEQERRASYVSRKS